MSITHTLMKPAQVRQGDVLITPVAHPVRDSDIGALVREGDGKRIVLAHGEATGHAHAFYPEQDVAEQAAEPKSGPLTRLATALGVGHEEVGTLVIGDVEAPVQLYELENASYYSGSNLPGQRLLRLNTRALLRHEEHQTISLPGGDYVVVRQHEGDELEEMRRVAD